MQETEHITGWIHYSLKEVSFIFFHSFFSKLDANWITKPLRSNSRISTPKLKKSLCKLLLKLLNGICDTLGKQIMLSSLQGLNLAA